MKQSPDTQTVLPELGSWRRLASLIALLRAREGGTTAQTASDAAMVAAQPASDDRTLRLLADPALRRQVAAVARIDAAARERRPSRTVPVRRIAPWATLALAASIAGLMFIRPFDATGRHRAGAAVTQVHLIEVGGARVAWASITGADLYEVEVVSRAGEQTFAATTTDTTLALPEWAQARESFYRVRARIEKDRWISSAFAEVRRVQ